MGVAARTAAHYYTRDSGIAHEAFTAGLLHDVGKLALAMNFPEEYQFALAIASEREVPIWVAEKEVLGATHAEAGAYLLSLWGLPSGMISAVAAHHEPAADLGTRFSASTAVHLANLLQTAREKQADLSAESLAAAGYPAELGLLDDYDGFREALGFTEEPDPELVSWASAAAGA